jgi:hypothetical protein
MLFVADKLDLSESRDDLASRAPFASLIDYDCLRGSVVGIRLSDRIQTDISFFSRVVSRNDRQVLQFRHAISMHMVIGRNIAVGRKVEIRFFHVIDNVIPTPAFVRNTLFTISRCFKARDTCNSPNRPQRIYSHLLPFWAIPMPCHLHIAAFVASSRSNAIRVRQKVPVSPRLSVSDLCCCS